MPIHVEEYHALIPTSKAKGGRRAFAYASPCTSKTTLAHPHLDDVGRLTFGVCEWSVQLWNDVHLDNTIDAYRGLALRNQLARGSAWGFFLTALPVAKPGNEKKGIYPSLMECLETFFSALGVRYV